LPLLKLTCIFFSRWEKEFEEAKNRPVPDEEDPLETGVGFSFGGPTPAGGILSGFLAPAPVSESSSASGWTFGSSTSALYFDSSPVRGSQSPQVTNQFRFNAGLADPSDPPAPLFGASASPAASIFGTPSAPPAKSSTTPASPTMFQFGGNLASPPQHQIHNQTTSMSSPSMFSFGGNTGSSAPPVGPGSPFNLASAYQAEQLVTAGAALLPSPILPGLEDIHQQTDEELLKKLNALFPLSEGPTLAENLSKVLTISTLLNTRKSLGGLGFLAGRPKKRGRPAVSSDFKSVPESLSESEDSSESAEIPKKGGATKKRGTPKKSPVKKAPAPKMATARAKKLSYSDSISGTDSEESEDVPKAKRGTMKTPTKKPAVKPAATKPAFRTAKKSSLTESEDDSPRKAPKKSPEIKKTPGGGTHVVWDSDSEESEDEPTKKASTTKKRAVSKSPVKRGRPAAVPAVAKYGAGSHSSEESEEAPKKKAAAPRKQPAPKAAATKKKASSQEEEDEKPAGRGSRLKKKDPNQPKRPMSAYMLYAGTERATIKQRMPEATFSQIAHSLGEQWKSMSEADKKPYLDQAERDKQRYNEEMQVYEGKK